MYYTYLRVAQKVAFPAHTITVPGLIIYAHLRHKNRIIQYHTGKDLSLLYEDVSL